MCIENQNRSICPQKEQNRIQRHNWGYQEFDNYAVRVLGGYEAMLAPPGGVNNTHFETAVSLLEQFDVILPLEDIDVEPFQSEMDAAIGWHIQRKQNIAARKNIHNINFSNTDIVRFTAINKYDIAL